MDWRFALGCSIAAMAAPARAGDAPLYQAAPAWVSPAPPPDPAKLDADAPLLLVFDSQNRVEGARVWSYIDTATRIASAQALGEAGQIAVPWAAEKGDLIVHRLEILRGGERIDLLAQGKRFQVLRREEDLERREMNGVLTATMAVEGLQVGDVLRMALSITNEDAALGGGAQLIRPLPTQPVRMGLGRVRLLWPEAQPMRWRVLSLDAQPKAKSAGGVREVTLALPLAKPAELPADAPDRFRRPPLLEAGSFADWEAVSRAFAPLYATDGLIAPGSPLAAEVAAIAAAEGDPLRRAQRALELAQDKVRYLAMGMNGGNYTPQKPADTWRLRYGDCKAKTLMLLAMLEAMGIEAEAALVASEGGGLLPERLPTPGAFDHVLVRATIGGESLWLDGTRGGSRLADIRDTPAFRHALPLRTAGTGLLAVPTRADARPAVEVTLDHDETAGDDLPTVFRAEVAMRGEPAAMLAAAAPQTNAEQKLELVQSLLSDYVGEAQLVDPKVTYDAAAGTATVSATGVATTPWSMVDKRRRRALGRALDMVAFEPDRARPAWAAIPVATPAPAGIVIRTRVRLPDGGEGYALEGEQALSGALGGAAVRRAVSFADGLVTVEERVDTTGAEIAPADVAAERARVAKSRAKPLRLVAPADAPRRWEIAARSDKAARLKNIEDVFARAIAASPKEVSGYQSRASFRAGVLDRRGAIEDLGRAVAIEPSVDLHLTRASLHQAMGDLAAALADVEAARKLDPGSSAAVGRLASLLSERGDHEGALALLEERIAQGGEDRRTFVIAKADVQADAGDVDAALATLDEALKEKPGDPALLNQRCWIKGTREVALDTALKDCTKAIELADSPAAALDSRAMVWLRMGRMEDALADLDAALDAAPGQAGSLYLRGVVRTQAGSAAQAKADLTAARLLSPQIEKRYGRWGVTP